MHTSIVTSEHCARQWAALTYLLLMRLTSLTLYHEHIEPNRIELEKQQLVIEINVLSDDLGRT